MVKKKILIFLLCLGVVVGDNQIECNLDYGFDPIEEDISVLPYGSCRKVREGRGKSLKLTIKETSSSGYDITLNPSVIYNIPNVSTSSLFTHDLIDQTTPTKHTSHANTQYLQWTATEQVHFCSSIHCLTFPNQSHFYLTTSLYPIHPKCDPANLILFLLPSNPQKLEHVCIHLNMDLSEHVLEISPPARNSAYYITQTPITELTIVSHTKGNLPQEKFIGKVPKDPSHASFPCTVTLLNDYLLLNNNKLNKLTLELQRSKASGPGFSITGLFFPLDTRTRHQVIRTPTRVYYAEQEYDTYKLTEQKPKNIPRKNEDGEVDGNVERLILQDFDPTEFPGGVTRLPEEGRYSAMYHESMGYEYPRAGRTITGAKALKRFLDMYKEWKEMDLKEESIESHPLGKYETIYYKRGETYLYSMITAKYNLEDWAYKRRVQDVFRKFFRRDWHDEGTRSRSWASYIRRDEFGGKRLEFSEDWERINPFDSDGWFMPLIRYYSIIVASLFVLVVLVHIYSCCYYTRKRVMQVDGVIQPPVA